MTVDGQDTWSETRVRALVGPFRAERGALMPALHAVQREFGYVERRAMQIVADVLNLSRAEVHGVITFYSDFRAAPPGSRTLRASAAPRRARRSARTAGRTCVHPARCRARRHVLRRRRLARAGVLPRELRPRSVGHARRPCVRARGPGAMRRPRLRPRAPTWPRPRSMSPRHVRPGGGRRRDRRGDQSGGARSEASMYASFATDRGASCGSNPWSRWRRRTGASRTGQSRRRRRVAVRRRLPLRRRPRARSRTHRGDPVARPSAADHVCSRGRGGSVLA